MLGIKKQKDEATTVREFMEALEKKIKSCAEAAEDAFARALKRGITEGIRSSHFALSYETEKEVWGELEVYLNGAIKQEGETIKALRKGYAAFERRMLERVLYNEPASGSIDPVSAGVDALIQEIYKRMLRNDLKILGDSLSEAEGKGD